MGFPSYRYGPDGQAKICQSEDDVPAGWVDHPSKVKEAKPDGDGAPKPRKAPKAKKK
jgi:hypothetical protein